MIHAFLFVTKNNRDRDGHGPEFQKHMHRINKDCGCNITIYHSFHEEVRMYQQHVWRCDGPCKTRKPFFGLVRRSMNRAPGPNDTWWSQHQATCGGKFVKVQEPENFGQKKSKSAAVKDSKEGDIRKFIFTGKGNILSGNTKPGEIKKPPALMGGPSASTNPIQSGRPLGLTNPVHTVNNGDFRANIDVTGNVRSFGGGRGHPNNGVGNARGNIRGRGGLRGATSNRGGNTLVVTGSKGAKKDETNTSSTETFNDFVPFQGRGNMLGKPSTSLSTKRPGIPSRILPVSNSTSIRPSTSKSTNTFGVANGASSIDANPIKKLKTVSEVNDKVISAEEDDVIMIDDPQVKCPVCNCSLAATAVNSHLDECLSRMAVSSTTVIAIDDDDDETEVNEENLDKCPLCSAYYPADKMETHVNACVETLHDAFEAQEAAEVKKEEVEPSDDKVPCPVCQTRIPQDKINQHLDVCLSESVISSEKFS